MPKTIIITTMLIVGIITAVGVVISYKNLNTIASISTFDECSQAGYPVMESYPAQCRTPDGRSFTQIVENQLEFTPEEDF